MTVDARLLTADDLVRMPDDGYRYELVRGELRKMSPAKREHGRIAGRIHVRLGAWVLERNLGDVYSSDTGFLLSRDPDTVRCPDVSFVRKERVEETDDFPSAADLAIEVISPTDKYNDVAEKKDQYLAAGVQAVVLVDPRRKALTVYRATGVTEVQEALTLDDLLPGFRLPLADLFA